MAVTTEAPIKSENSQNTREVDFFDRIFTVPFSKFFLTKLAGQLPYEAQYTIDAVLLEVEKRGKERSPQTAAEEFAELGIIYPELNYYVNNFATLQKDHPNQWVAISGETVLASDPSEKKVRSELKKTGIKKAIVFWLPDDSPEN